MQNMRLWRRFGWSSNPSVSWPMLGTHRPQLDVGDIELDFYVKNRVAYLVASRMGMSSPPTPLSHVAAEAWLPMSLAEKG